MVIFNSYVKLPEGNFQDLISEMFDKIDASATRQLRGLEPTEAPWDGRRGIPW